MSAVAHAQSPREASFADIVLNGRIVQEFALVVREADTFYVDGAVYQALRLIHESERQIEMAGTVYYAIPDHAPLSISFDEEDLVLDIQAPPDLFPTTNLTFIGRAEVAEPLEPISGFFVNYGLYPRTRFIFEDEIELDQSSLSGDLQFVGALKNLPGVFEVETGIFWDETDRFDTTFIGGRWRWNILEQRKSLIVGETTTQGLSITPSERFLGAKISTNYQLDPAFSITPAIALDLLIDQPSEVRLLVDGRARRVWEAQEGPLRLSDLAVGNGQDVRILVSNDGGETEVFQTTYYTAARLLRPGLSEFSLSGGVPESFNLDLDWQRPFVSYAVRRGLTQHITTGGALRIDADRQSLGGGIDSSLGSAGILSLNGFIEQAETGSIHRLNGGWFFTHHQNNFGAAASWSSFERDDFDPRESWNVNLSWGRPLAKQSRFSVSAYVRRQDTETPTASGVFATVGTKIAGLNLGFNGGYRRAQQDDFFVGFSLSRQLGNRRNVFSQVRTERHKLLSNHAIYQRALTPDGIDTGVLIAIDDESGIQNISGTATWRHPKATLSSSLSVSQSSASLNAQVTGSIGQVDGLGFYSQRIAGAVAVADLVDATDTDILLNNRRVGRTNQNGVAVVPGLVSFHNNRIAVDGDDIPLEYYLAQSEALIFPTNPIAGRVRLPVKLNRTGTLTLTLSGEGYPPPGTTTLAQNSDASGIIGHNGFVYLRDLSEGLNQFAVRTRNGRCVFDVYVIDLVSQFGDIICE